MLDYYVHEIIITNLLITMMTYYVILYFKFTNQTSATFSVKHEKNPKNHIHESNSMKKDRK